MSDREIFERFGYDPDAPVPRDEEGDLVLPERLLSRMADAPIVDESTLDSETHPGPWTQPLLTKAEVRVLQCLSVGLGASGAADVLGVSWNTVNTQSKCARIKLRAKNTVHACCIAIAEGLIDGPPVREGQVR